MSIKLVPTNIIPIQNAEIDIAAIEHEAEKFNFPSPFSNDELGKDLSFVDWSNFAPLHEIERRMHLISPMPALQNFVQNLQLPQIKNFAYAGLCTQHSAQTNNCWYRYSRKLLRFVALAQAPDFSGEVVITDCETFVQGSDYGHAIINVTCTAKDVYIWLHGALGAAKEYEPCYIPDFNPAFAIAHNSAFDRGRFASTYKFGRNNVRWLDTMSMHNTCAKIIAQQVFAYESEDAQYLPLLWKGSGAKSSLIDAYNFHINPVIPLTKADKTARNIFVDAIDIAQIADVLEQSIAYAVSDVVRTSELFCAMLPKYIHHAPHAASIIGHSAIANSTVVLSADWDNWIERCTALHAEYAKKIHVLLQSAAAEAYELWLDCPEAIEDCPWLSQLDWSCTKKGKYAGIPKWYRETKIDGKQLSLRANCVPLILKVSYCSEHVVYDKSNKWCCNNLQPIPHPKKVGANVGGLFAADFYELWENGELSCKTAAGAELVSAASIIAYWTGNSSRIKKVHCVKINIA